MYVVSGCKGRDLTLQGGVIHVTFMLQSSFFCLETKERSKEKFKADFFLLLASFTSLKGRNSLRSNSLPFLTLRYGRSHDGEKSRPGKAAGWSAVWCSWEVLGRNSLYLSIFLSLLSLLYRILYLYYILFNFAIFSRITSAAFYSKAFLLVAFVICKVL